MLGGLVPVSLPFQFSSLLNFTTPGATGASGMGTVPGANSGYSLAQNELMGKSRIAVEYSLTDRELSQGHKLFLHRCVADMLHVNLNV